MKAKDCCWDCLWRDRSLLWVWFHW